MLLIYTPRLTNRIGYTLNVLLKHILRCDFSITTDENHFSEYGGAKICYAPKKVGDGLFIKSCGLLNTTSIEDQEPKHFIVDEKHALFPVFGREIDFPFDLLAASFYMISRYEEYLPHKEDLHGRFIASQSVAAEYGFLESPVVDQWTEMLREKINERYPDLSLSKRSYTFVQTVDIDAAWCYLHKGFLRTVGGFLRDILHQQIDRVGLRCKVLRHKEADPYDTFDYIISHRCDTAGSHLIFFPLLADYDRYDKPSNYLNPHTRELLQHLGDYAKTGIHIGYNALLEPHRADVETKRLEEILHRTIVRGRYHYLRLQLPNSYRILIHAGIKHDYTMGYADALGFRAGISVPYPFYDLERDAETELTIHPFCSMDTTLRQYLKLTPQEAERKYEEMITAVKKTGGNFCCIVHNQNLCEMDGWEGWREVYEKMIEMAKP